MKLGEEATPGRLVGQEDVVTGLERQQPRPRKQGSEDPPFFERHHPVVAGMSHEGIHRHARDELADIDGGAGLIEPDSGFRRRRLALELVVPGHLLLASLGQEEHREEMAERRIRVGPARADDRDQSFVSPALAFAPAQPSSRVAAVEDEPLDSFGMTRGIRDGCRRPLRYPEQHETVEPGGVDDALEVRHPAVQRDLSGRPIGQATTALVVPNERVPFAQPLQPVTPDRAPPVELEMSEPVPGLHDRRAAAVPRPCEPRAVRRDAEANLLVHTEMLCAGGRHVPVHSSATDPRARRFA